MSNKFDKLEGDSKDKMEEYEAKIYTLEKSHIREQDRLKKEMMERVENVAGDNNNNNKTKKTITITTITYRLKKEMMERVENVAGDNNNNNNNKNNYNNNNNNNC